MAYQNAHTPFNDDGFQTGIPVSYVDDDVAAEIVQQSEVWSIDVVVV
jgi:hypothetical protein